MIEIREIDQPIHLPAPYGQMHHSCLQRLLDAYGPEDVQELCWFLIVEPSDTPADLGRFVDPVWEWKDEYPDHIELYYVQSDSGYGPIVIVPLEGTHPEILELLRS